MSRAIRNRGRISEVLVHTGQHYDEAMSDVFFAQLELPRPAHHLGVAGGTHAEMTGRMMIGIEQVVLGEHPDAVLVYGDTNSTLAGALAAAKLTIPVAHVEAGLRSFTGTSRTTLWWWGCPRRSSDGCAIAATGSSSPTPPTGNP